MNKHNVPSHIRRNRTIFSAFLLALAVGGLLYGGVTLVRALSAMALGLAVGIAVLLLAAKTRAAPAYFIAAGVAVIFVTSLTIFDAPTGEPVAAFLVYLSTVMLAVDFIAFRDR